jgi:hypothetical protein
MGEGTSKRWISDTKQKSGDLTTARLLQIQEVGGFFPNLIPAKLMNHSCFTV